jgi:hypothetical protein
MEVYFLLFIHYSYVYTLFGPSLPWWQLIGLSNKLCVWVWHSPIPPKGASIIMPNKLHVWIRTASAAEVGRMQYSCFSFNVYIQREAITGSPCSQGLQCHAPFHLMLQLYIKNSLEVERVGVSPSEHPTCLAPALCMFGLLSVVFSNISHHPQLGF